MDLQPDQIAAVDTLDRHVSVTAGPGSGKTTVLVARYLNILREQKISVDQIVAITFTNRAANEMRTRLRAELDTLMRHGSAKERARWLRHKRTLDGAVITTFHGFCVRLLREFPVEAEIDPQFVLLDETQSTMLIEAVVDAALTDEINNGNGAITRLVVGVGRGAVRRAVVRIYRAMRGQGLELDVLRERTATSHASGEDYGAAFHEADELMRDFISRSRLSPVAETKRREAETHWPQAREILANVPTIESLPEYCLAVEELRAAARPTKSGKLSLLVEKLDQVLWGEKSTDPYGRVPRICFDQLARDYALELLDVVQRVEIRLEEQKRNIAALDFDDLLYRVLKLFDARTDVLNRIAARYRYFLVDEFQDTNNQQRELMQRLALSSAQRANLFVVGDRKQSIYGFRGADVDVFRAMAVDIEESGGVLRPLSSNFRSRRALISFFNCLFHSVFQNYGDVPLDELNELGYVEHEPSVARRDELDDSPIVELLIDVRDRERDEAEVDELVSTASSRERDAEQIASRILSLVEERSLFSYRDIALLFRAMPNIAEYEIVLRRHGIPYRTVQGKGFYAREEITDLLQLLRFLDNTTDEIALASVLRSPLCGLSDDALLALRCAPPIDRSKPAPKPRPAPKLSEGVRPLLDAVMSFASIAFIHDDERPALERTRRYLADLIDKRNSMSVADLLRYAVNGSEYLSVIAANFDGAQRISNVWKLFELAERFERSDANMIRDFVRFVEEFESVGGREAEGQVDESADAVVLMTIHQSKGQEFPVVVIPDLKRDLVRAENEWFMFDRTRGLTVKVPDGRGGTVCGLTLTTLREREKHRSLLEEMRLLYVAATRAQERLILSGASTKEITVNGARESWLKWVMAALGVDGNCAPGPFAVNDDVSVEIYVNLPDAARTSARSAGESVASQETRIESWGAIDELFPLMQPLVSRASLSLPYAVEPERNALHRFSVTQLINFQRCPRQYFFDRILRAPSSEQLEAWNDAEAPEPPANLTATLRGAIIHRFCEAYRKGDVVEDVLRSSFDYVVARRPPSASDVIDEVKREAAIADVMPLAEHYLRSEAFERIDAALAAEESSSGERVVSEQRFMLMRPLGSLSGTIDKIVVTPVEGRDRVDVEIIDFKTDRFPKRVRSRPRSRSRSAEDEGEELTIAEQIGEAVSDYALQMQAYALAVYELYPNLNNLRLTIHFLDPEVETSLGRDLLERSACTRAIDDAMMSLLASAPSSYPTRVAAHCRFCAFRPICADGQEWFRRAMQN